MLSVRRAARVTFSIGQSGMITNPPILKPKNPTVLIVGGSGRLGGLLRRVWTQSPPAADLRWQARRPAPFAATVFDPLADARAYACAAEGADLILNLAGVVSGSEAALAANGALALAALGAARAAGVGWVALASSAAVYGAAAGVLHEAGPAVPVAPYGVAKLAMEAAALDSCQAAGGPGVVALRIGNVAGADALLGRAAPAQGRILDVFADGRAPRRSYIGPVALAAAMIRLAELAAGAGAVLPERLNLALPGAVGMDDLLRADGQGWRTRPAPRSAIAEVCLDVRRAVALGLVPATPGRAEAVVADLRKALIEDPL